MDIGFRKINKADLSLREKWLNDPEIVQMVGYAGENNAKSNLRWFESLDETKQFYIILVDSSPVGFVGLKNITAKDAEVFVLIGDKNFWGAGIGKAALKHILMVAKQYGAQKVYLDVAKENARAIHLYKKIGFNITETIEDEIHMEIML